MNEWINEWLNQKKEHKYSREKVVKEGAVRRKIWPQVQRSKRPAKLPLITTYPWVSGDEKGPPLPRCEVHYPPFEDLSHSTQWQPCSEIENIDNYFIYSKYSVIRHV